MLAGWLAFCSTDVISPDEIVAQRLSNIDLHTNDRVVIIRSIMRWNIHSNACDVLALGPRTAGQLATVGVRTIAELTAAQAAVVARRIAEASITPAVVAQWQREARLILELPELPHDAARLLAAADYACLKTLAASTPTELLAALEVARQTCDDGWLAHAPLPEVVTAISWIDLARQTKKSLAA